MVVQNIAHVWTVMVILIYLRHFLALSQSFKQFLSVSLYICKTYSELPTYISITLLILFLPLARSIHSIFLHLLRPYLEMSILSCSFQSPWKNNAFHADLFSLTLLRSFFCTPVWRMDEILLSCTFLLGFCRTKIL